MGTLQVTHRRRFLRSWRSRLRGLERFGRREKIPSKAVAIHPGGAKSTARTFSGRPRHIGPKDLSKLHLCLGTNPESGRTDSRLTDGRCRFRKLQILYWPTGFYDQSGLEVECFNLRNGRSVICRMIFQVPNNLKALQIYSVYLILISDGLPLSNSN